MMRLKLALTLLFAVACSKKPVVTSEVAPQGPAEIKAALEALCRPSMMNPRVVPVGKRVHVAIGYDLANVIMIETSVGPVIIDTAMSPGRAKLAREALLGRTTDQKVRAIIYTHSHLDHVGGAGVFKDSGTEIWASAPFEKNFLKQYGLFQPIETIRGMRQYGRRVDRAFLPCTGLGILPDIDLATDSGARLPTKTFKDKVELSFGDVKLVLEEAHGETPDTLLAWLPGERIAFPGDNFYRAFPNLYTIRGTAARPVDEWIASLDRLRELRPAAIVPSHTEPILGEVEVQEALTAYRDGIQFVRDTVVRGANQGESAASIAERVRLPKHLAAHPFLQESYGRVDWSALGIYSDNLGWFGGEPELLAPMPRAEVARREVELMGGPLKLVDLAHNALDANDAPWALHLLARLEHVKLDGVALMKRVHALKAQALRAAAVATSNTNARGYLAESAIDLEVGKLGPIQGRPDEAMMRDLSLSIFFQALTTRLDQNGALDVVESVRWTFHDLNEQWIVTIRRGVAEARRGEPLPGTPEPLAVISTDSMTWKSLALRRTNIAAVLATGALSIEGSAVGFASFMSRFLL